MNLCKKVVTGSAALLLAGVANVSMSAAIFMDPDPVLANVGDVVLVDLLWDGSGGEYVAGWDLDMSFDSAVLSFVSADYDTDDALGDHIAFSTDLDAGLVNMFGLSFEASEDLVAGQDGLGNVFNLATIEFTAIGVGDIDVMLTGNSFSDPDGIALTDVMLTGSEACVDPVGTVPACGGDTPMPEPGILSLFGLSLLALAFTRRRPLV